MEAKSKEFIKEMKDIVIPIIERMIEKEKVHLKWLIDQEEKDAILSSEGRLNQLNYSHKLYKDYINEEI